MITKLWLPLCACSILVVSGCSGGSQVAPAAPANPSAAEHVASNALGEALIARKVVVTTRSCAPNHSSAVVTFTASGAAKGPFKGTFTTTGTWNFTKIPGNDLWTFSQKYVIKTRAGLVDGTITGSGQKIKATCKAFGPATGKANLKFTLGQKSGSATTNDIRHGSLEEHLN
jgi:hypothetical protein